MVLYHRSFGMGVTCFSCSFFQKFKIPGVIGCIDGTFVSMIRPKEHEERYYCRKGYHARNVLVVSINI